jgi:hypothetical protein
VWQTQTPRRMLSADLRGEETCRTTYFDGIHDSTLKTSGDVEALEARDVEIKCGHLTQDGWCRRHAMTRKTPLKLPNSKQTSLHPLPTAHHAHPPFKATGNTGTTDANCTERTVDSHAF